MKRQLVKAPDGLWCVFIRDELDLMRLRSRPRKGRGRAVPVVALLSSVASGARRLGRSRQPGAEVRPLTEELEDLEHHPAHGGASGRACSRLDAIGHLSRRGGVSVAKPVHAELDVELGDQERRDAFVDAGPAQARGQIR